MASYPQALKEHLARYKREHLGVLEDGVWVKNGRAYPHILPARLGHLNVLETIRSEFWEFHGLREAVIALQRDFHHLNSSQALAFNLFFPFFGLSEPVTAPCSLCSASLDGAYGVGPSRRSLILQRRPTSTS